VSHGPGRSCVQSLCLFVLVGLIAIFCLPPGVHHVTAAPQRRQQAGEHLRHLTVNGLRRFYLLHMPSNLDLVTPAAVILAFHPGFATAQGFAENTRLSTRAGHAGFVVVYPQGYGRSWNAGDCCGPALRQGIDDVTFVRAVLADLVSVVKVDPHRIFATGFSNGAKMAYRLACELSERIVAIAPVGAATSMSDSACRPMRHLPVLHFHGLADRFAPFQGGPSSHPPAGEQRSIPETIRFWLRQNGCTAATRVTYRRGAAMCTAHPNCHEDAQIILCTIERMGHQWPGGRVVFPRIFGPGTTDISATEMIVEFFLSHPMPQRE
jgi:polyhydroxybutyrate depolymerase